MTTEADKIAEEFIRRLDMLFADCPARGKGRSHAWNFQTGRCEACPQLWPYAVDPPCHHAMWDWDIFGDRCPTCGKKMR